MDASLYTFLGVDEAERAAELPWLVGAVHGLPRCGFTNRPATNQSEHQKGVGAVALIELLWLPILALLACRAIAKHGVTRIRARSRVISLVCVAALTAAMVCQCSRTPGELLSELSITESPHKQTYFTMTLTEDQYLDNYFQDVVKTLMTPYRGKPVEGVIENERDVGYADLVAHRELAALVRYGRRLSVYDPDQRHVVSTRADTGVMSKLLYSASLDMKLLVLGVLVMVTAVTCCRLFTVGACVGAVGCCLALARVTAITLNFCDGCFLPPPELSPGDEGAGNYTSAGDDSTAGDGVGGGGGADGTGSTGDGGDAGAGGDEGGGGAPHRIIRQAGSGERSNPSLDIINSTDSFNDTEEIYAENDDRYYFKQVCNKWSESFEAHLSKYSEMFSDASKKLYRRSFSVSSGEFDELNVSERQQLFLFYVRDQISKCKKTSEGIPRPRAERLCSGGAVGGSVLARNNDDPCRTSYYVSLFVIECLIQLAALCITSLLLIFVPKPPEVVCKSMLCSEHINKLRRKKKRLRDYCCGCLRFCFRWLACCCVYETDVPSAPARPCPLDGTCNRDNPCGPGEICDQYIDCPGLHTEDELQQAVKLGKK